jgi:hypothetical protein
MDDRQFKSYRAHRPEQGVTDWRALGWRVKDRTEVPR